MWKSLLMLWYSRLLTGLNSTIWFQSLTLFLRCLKRSITNARLRRSSMLWTQSSILLSSKIPKNHCFIATLSPSKLAPNIYSTTSPSSSKSGSTSQICINFLDPYTSATGRLVLQLKFRSTSNALRPALASSVPSTSINSSSQIKKLCLPHCSKLKRTWRWSNSSWLYSTRVTPLCHRNRLFTKFWASFAPCSSTKISLSDYPQVRANPPSSGCASLCIRLSSTTPKSTAKKISTSLPYTMPSIF